MDRTVLITGQDDVKDHAACTALSSLTIRSGAALDLSALRALTSITGDLQIGPTVGMEELQLPELRSVGGTIKIESNGLLRGMFLPRLERAGRVDVEANGSLTTIAMPRLAEVQGTLLITSNASLELIDLSALVTVGKDLAIADNPVLALIEAGKVTAAQELRIERNPKLPADQVEAVRAKPPAP